MINTENFYSSYYKDTTKDKALPTASRIRFENGVVENVLLEDKEFTDAFRSSVQVLPFTSNPSTSNYDRSCGLRGITGEFFRKSKDRQTKAISDFENNAIQPVRNYLLQQKHMKEKQVEEFIEIMKDVMYSDGSLTIMDPSFLKFLPLTDGNTNSKKYEHGQRSIAEYLSSMLCPKDLLVDMLSKKPNLFNEIIISALSSSTGTGGSNENEYIILPFIKESFGEDLKWFLKRDDSIVVKYIHVFLHFYLCYSLSQTLVCLDYRKYNIVPEKPQKMYYILTSEHASEGREAVTNGWNKYVNKEALEKSFGRIEALDILNSLLDGNIGFYNDVYNKLREQDFNDEIKMLLEDVICSYQRDKREQLKKREVAKFQFPDEVSTEVNSYDDFILKLGLLCTTLQSKEYESKMKIRVNNIMKIRMLSTRRGREILNFDDEMLFFLMAMISKGTRMKLEDLYEGFGKYGVAFDYDTKAAIENYLLKLNLLERKSDSGEAQYVKIVL